jgi:hypothetical protein
VLRYHVVSSLQVFRQMSYVSHFLHACYMFYPCELPWLYYHDNILLRKHIQNRSSICNFFLFVCYILLLNFSISPTHTQMKPRQIQDLMLSQQRLWSILSSGTSSNCVTLYPTRQNSSRYEYIGTYITSHKREFFKIYRYVHCIPQERTLQDI